MLKCIPNVLYGTTYTPDLGSLVSPDPIPTIIHRNLGFLATLSLNLVNDFIASSIWLSPSLI